MSMWVTAKTPASPDPLRVIVHGVVNRRGRRKFLTTMAGRAICVSENQIVCTAETFLDQGHSPATQVLFRDAVTCGEEVMTLAQAADWQMPGLGDVVPFHRLVRPITGSSGGDAA